MFITDAGENEEAPASDAMKDESDSKRLLVELALFPSAATAPVRPSPLFLFSIRPLGLERIYFL
jgi:hypothetical protein